MATTKTTRVTRKHKADSPPEIVIGELVTVADLAAERRRTVDVAGAIAGAVVAEFAATIRSVHQAQQTILRGVTQCQAAQATADPGAPGC